MELYNKKITVVGLGKTGFATALFLQKKGAIVTVTDTAGEDSIGGKAADLKKIGVRVELGGHTTASFENADLIVLSPGIPETISPLKKAALKRVPITGEIELASRFIKEPVIAVTGTNGKTTVTALIGKMLECSGLKVFVGGNIGNPLISYIDQKEKAQVVVVELSSFQLDTIDTFRPKVSVLLNITQDHLDRYKNFNAYVESKGRIFKNQTKEDFAVYNDSDPFVIKLAENIKAKKIPFRLDLKENHSVISQLNFSRIKLFGTHNLENIYAASLAAAAGGGTSAGIQNAVNSFKGLGHRLEYIKTVENVKYFDDSKATNPDAVKKALESFAQPVILIMGGRNKGYDFNMLAEPVKKHVKRLILLGEARDEIRSALGGIISCETVSSMDEAVFAAHRASESKDVVLLSPACSSFDMFTGYAQRGEAFQQIVNKLSI